MVHLPALNTPHFSWVRSRLPRKPQPVPPIYQPEIAADAIVWAAHHNRREVHVGLPTVVAIGGNKMFAGAMDRYLAHKGYDSQQTVEPADPERPDNLWTPLPGDRGAHGRFEDGTASSSSQFWFTTHRPWVLGFGLAAIASIAIVRRLR